MPAKDDLTFTIDLCSDDEAQVETPLVKVASQSLAYVAFDAAKVIYKDRIVTLRGPEVSETHRPHMQ
jgi:hypothetical protein